MKKTFLSLMFLTQFTMTATQTQRPVHGDYTTAQVAISNFANVAANAIALTQGGDPGQCILQIMQSIFNIAMAAAEDDKMTAEECTLPYMQYRLCKILESFSPAERKELKRQIRILLKKICHNRSHVADDRSTT
jgi:hypothetical protein